MQEKFGNNVAIIGDGGDLPSTYVSPSAELQETHTLSTCSTAKKLFYPFDLKKAKSSLCLFFPSTTLPRSHILFFKHPMLHDMNAYVRGIDHFLSNQVCASRFAVFYRCGLPSLAATVLAHQ